VLTFFFRRDTMEKIKLKDNPLGRYIKGKIEEAIQELKDFPEKKKAYGLADNFEEIEVELI